MALSGGEAAIDSVIVALYANARALPGCTCDADSRCVYLWQCSYEMPGDVRDGNAQSGEAVTLESSDSERAGPVLSPPKEGGVQRRSHREPLEMRLHCESREDRR